MDIPSQLNGNERFSSLSFAYDPSTLHNTDMLAYSWKTMPFMMTPSMEVDDQSDRIPMSNRRRSKSPPTSPTPEESPQADDRGLAVFNVLPKENTVNPKMLDNQAQHQQNCELHQNLGLKDCHRSQP